MKNNSQRDFGREITQTYASDNRKFWIRINELRGNRRRGRGARKNRSNKLKTEGTQQKYEEKN